MTAVGLEGQAHPTYPKVQHWDNGLTLIHDFVTSHEEATIISAFHDADPRRGGTRRISQHFGYHFDYTTFGASETTFTPVPEYISTFLSRLPIQHYLPDQFTVQYYPPGSGIPPHVDTHSMFREALYSLSLGSDVRMLFRKVNDSDARRMRVPKRSLQVEEPSSVDIVSSIGVGETRERSALSKWDSADESFEILLPRRSLLVMQREARYGYVHGIRSRKTDWLNGRTVPRTDRYSVTMRTAVRGLDIGCDCEFPEVCDARIREETGVKV
jgi:alkylated DNA repair protein alkB homolog 8